MPASRAGPMPVPIRKIQNREVHEVMKRTFQPKKRQRSKEHVALSCLPDRQQDPSQGVIYIRAAARRKLLRAAEMRLVFFGLMGRPFSSCAENGGNRPQNGRKPAKRAIAVL